MQEYHKIETIFERDEKTKKLIVGKFHNPTVEFLKDIIWDGSEKVDGTNIRVQWDGHQVNYGGRMDKTQIPQHLLTKLDGYFGGIANEEIFEQRFGEKEVIIFGEGYGEKIQTNGYIDRVDFIVFDVMINGNYQPRETVEEIASIFGLKVVPILISGTLDELVNFVLSNTKSFVSEVGGTIEVIVAKPHVELQDRTGHRLIVKIKRKDFDLR